jgi:hypothetical protein
VLHFSAFPFHKIQISERRDASSYSSISLYLCTRGRDRFLLFGRSGRIHPHRSNRIHSVYLERRWLRGAAAHAAGLPQLQSCVVSQGRLDCLYVGAGRPRQPLSHASRRQPRGTADRRRGLRRSGRILTRWRANCLCFYSGRGFCESLGPGPRNSQGAGVDHRTGWRFQAGVVSRWPLDRLLLGP